MLFILHRAWTHHGGNLVRIGWAAMKLTIRPWHLSTQYI